LAEQLPEGAAWVTTVAKQPAEDLLAAANGISKPQQRGFGDAAEKEALASRTALNNELATLGERFLSRGHLLGQTDSPFHAAYRALSTEQENLLDLRHSRDGATGATSEFACSSRSGCGQCPRSTPATSK